jgi:hypothetical protein
VRVGERDRALVHVVDHAARCCDDHARVFLQRGNLFHHGGTADYDRRANTKRWTNLAECFLDLHGEFARGHKHEPLTFFLEQALDQRNGEGKCFTGSCLGNAHKIFAFHCGQNGFLLDGSGYFEFQLVKDLEHSRRYAEAVEA